MSAGSGNRDSVSPRTQSLVGDALDTRSIKRDKRIDLFCERAVAEQMARAAKVSLTFFTDGCNKNQRSACPNVRGIHRAVHCKQRRKTASVITDSRCEQSIAKSFNLCF